MAELVVVGDAVTDVVVQLGATRSPASDTPAAITMQPGGQGANTAAWSARSGASPHLVACVGRDARGEQLETALAAADVHTHVQRAELPTGTIVVVVYVDGERTMFTDRGANRRLSPVPGDLLAPGVHLHLSGYVLLDPASREAGRRTLAAAAAAGAALSVSASSSAPLAAAGGRSFLEWTRGADLLVGNRAEVELLCDIAEPPAAARHLLEDYGAVAVTDGATGVWWASRAGESRHLPAPGAEVVDSAGAGDAFTAGLLAALLDGAPEIDALQQGMDLARQAIGRRGAWPRDR